ncbi:sensor histidine kinase [Tahibacter soli]|uniref:histidine kinase n=1 Tax=Tahibacter soli TaxID=2983605 RepID=A0A9X3YL61_9GAMM|nr:ATP-binding protein [Tahibacter soli]MDC8013250.1 ATP-binding protein [Tahibacter soli]
MTSLRRRLFGVLVGAFLGFWLLWVALWAMFMQREGTGLWDGSLAANAQTIARTMPRDRELLAIAPVTGLPANVWMRDDMIYQVWAGGTLLIRSHDAPAAPIKPDFLDGFDERDIDGARFRVYAVSDAAHGIQVQAAKAHSHLEQIARWLAGATLTTVGLLLALLAAALWLGIRWSLKPVDALCEAVAARATFDLAPLPTAQLPSELRGLVDTFNAQLARLDRAVQGERRFVADAAHELRTPLAVLSAHAQIALRAHDVADKDEALRLLAAGIDRGARLSEQLLDLARLDASADGARRRRTDLAELAELVARDYAASARRNAQQIVLSTQPCPLVGDVDELGIQLRNLIDNALRYGGAGARVEIRCAPRDGGGGTLCVADDGPGVAPDERERIFDRFYRVAGSRERGSGIGLSLVARIAASHGATIAVGDGVGGRGFGVTILFP